jgi:hypothetical protein
MIIFIRIRIQLHSILIGNAAKKTGLGCLKKKFGWGSDSENEKATSLICTIFFGVRGNGAGCREKEG